MSDDTIWKLPENLSDALHITPEYATAIGYFAVAFSTMESGMNRAVWQLIDVRSYIGENITGQVINFSSRANMLASLGKAKLKDPDLRSDLAAAIRGVHYVNTQRNDFLHGEMGAWIPGVDPVAAMIRVKPGSEITKTLASFPLSFLNELTRYTLTVSTVLQIFYSNARYQRRAVTPPSLDKRPQRPATSFDGQGRTQ